LIHFSQFSAATYNLKVNYAEMVEDRSRQPAYIWNFPRFKRSFCSPASFDRPHRPTFKKICARECQRRVPP